MREGYRLQTQPFEGRHSEKAKGKKTKGKGQRGCLLLAFLPFAIYQLAADYGLPD